MSTYLTAASAMLFGSSLVSAMCMVMGVANRGTGIVLGLFAINLVVAYGFSLFRKE